MAYDRYVAICKLLYYLTVMNRQICILLVVVATAGLSAMAREAVAMETPARWATVCLLRWGWRWLRKKATAPAAFF